MRALIKHEKVIFWVLIVISVLLSGYCFLLGYNQLLVTVPMILLFIRRCPKALYIVICAIFLLLHVNMLISYSYSVVFVLNIILIPIACLLVVLRFKPVGKIALSALILKCIGLISYCVIVSFQYYSINEFINTYGLLIIFEEIIIIVDLVLIFVLTTTTRRCSCGYIYRQKAKFCGGCGKAFELK